MKNKNLVLFIGVGFIVTIAIWGFVGGCGTISNRLTASSVVKDEPVEQDAPAVEKTTVGSSLRESPTSNILEAEQSSAKKAVRQTYIVQQGDTLWKISKKFGVSVQSIKDANSLKTDNILVGHNIVIPGDDKITEKKDTKPLEVLEPKKETKKVEAKQIKTEDAPKEIKEEKLEMPVQSETKLQAKPGTVVYVVRKNDSLWRIAQSCGTTPEKIAELNNFSKNAQLMPGKEILVPSE